MKTMLFGLALAGVGLGIVVWAARRALDFSDIQVPVATDPERTQVTVDEAINRELMAFHSAHVALNTWPLFGPQGTRRPIN